MTAHRLAAAALAILALTGCGGTSDAPASTDAAATPSATSEATQETSPSPSGTSEFTPSGDFATDVEALGMKPDDVSSYEEFIVQAVCDSDLEQHPGGGSELDMQARTLGDTDPSSGRHPDVVRAAAAYNCPERAEDVEDALRKAQEGGFID